MVDRNKRFAGVMVGGLTLGVALAGGLGGCTSYTNVAERESYNDGQDPNSRTASSAARTALEWVTLRHGTPGAYAINLPEGTSLETADRIAEALGPNAVIPTSETVDLPTFHVGRVWIRLSEAKVDVVYPMSTFDGRQIVRGVTVWMNADFGGWKVRRGQYWSPGTVPPPPIWVPIPQAELDAIRAAEEAAAEAASNPQPQPETQPETQPEPAPAEPQPAPDTKPVEPSPEPAPTDPNAIYREIPTGDGR